MTLRKYLNLMCVLTGICWLAWLIVIFFVNPEKTGLVGFILFYFSLFLAVLGTAAVIGFVVRVQLSQKPVFAQVEIAFRQGIWIGLVVVAGLLLRGFNLLKWWNSLFLILFFVVLELFFLSSKRKYKA